MRFHDVVGLAALRALGIIRDRARPVTGDCGTRRLVGSALFAGVSALMTFLASDRGVAAFRTLTEVTLAILA